MNPFWNERERRLPALWRLLLQVSLLVIIGLALGTLVAVALPLLGAQTAGGGTAGLLADPVFFAVNYGVSLVAVVASVWLAARFLDRRSFSDFGLRLDKDWWLDFGFGLFLGALLMTGIFLVELAAGWVRVVGTFETAGGGSFFPVILAPLAAFLCVGFAEELSSRGYQLKNLAEGLNYPVLGGPKGAVILSWAVSSMIFGLLHAANPNATAISTINIALAGLLLGVGYVLTGRLAIPIGLHITWNFFQGNVFGFPVSGIDPIGASVFSIEQGGPPVVTGGAFGPEAGLAVIAAIVIGSLLTWLWVRVRHGKATIETSIAEPPVRRGEEAPEV